MGQAKADDVIQTAQTHLNDFGQKFWTQDLLFVFLQEAHRDLQLELQKNGIAVIKRKSTSFTLPKVTGATWNGVAYNGFVTIPTPTGTTTTLTLPTDLIEPLECFERQTGDTLGSDWDLMIPKSFLPEVDPVFDLVYWAWMNETLNFVGATQSVDIKFYYNGGIPLPASSEDTMGFLNAESYIAPKLASYAAASVGARAVADRLEKLAMQRLDSLLQYNVNGEQAQPVRRRPYRHGRRPFLIR